MVKRPRLKDTLAERILSQTAVQLLLTASGLRAERSRNWHRGILENVMVALR
jgi:hypothetical protein